MLPIVATRARSHLGSDRHLLPRYREGTILLERLNAEQVARAEREAQEAGEPIQVVKSKLPGDPWALRGIPALSRGGVGGAIRGTRPDRRNSGSASDA
jgi:hypothetical protein